jgi:hypothetical protein
VKSGAVFTTPGSGFRNDSTKFSEVNAGYAIVADNFIYGEPRPIQ